MAWDDAGNYCSSLMLGGFSGWRLPTLDEMQAAKYFFPVTETDKNGIDQTVDYLAMKGGISISYATRVWTSTPAGDQQYVSVFMGPPDLFGILFKPKHTIWTYNPSVTIARVHTLDSQLSDSLAPEHLETGIFVAFGAAALLLALLGIYGTLNYSVEARTQEVGIRMALGATRESVYRLMLGTIVAPVAAGLILGCLASLGIGRSLASLLYNTKPTDLFVILPVIAIFAIAAVAATLIPCRRAAKIEPMQALRSE